MRLFFQFVFYEAHLFFAGNETFCEHRELFYAFGHYATFSEKNTFLNGFFVVSSWEKVVFESYEYLLAYFWL